VLDRLAHLGLAVADLERSAAFYGDVLGLPPADAGASPVGDGGALAYPVGDAALVLRRPTGRPRGEAHVHYALTAPADALGEWRERLAGLDPHEEEFGSFRSLYVYDPDDHCVEVAAAGEPADADLTGVFEVVLEVRDLAAAERTYRALGFEPVDRGEERRRVRLRGPTDLELWEPQVGLAGARGGVHVDLGFVTDDPAAAAEAVEDGRDREPVSDGVRVFDRDGHALTFRRP
jgi:catechol 2,3-dioxygenase-like lactoylglutathione lyase family enzyme